MSSSIVGAAAQSADAATKTTTPRMNIRRRP
jgi:hypothetical protein